MKTRVIIESPFATSDDKQRLDYAKYLERAVADCLARDEAPFASHGFYTKFLKDYMKDERELGIACGLAWMLAADKVYVYSDYGTSAGMQQGIDFALENHLPVVYVTIGKN